MKHMFIPFRGSVFANPESVKEKMKKALADAEKMYG